MFKLNPAKMKMLTGFVDTYLRLGDDEEKWLRTELADLVPKEAFMEWITPWHRWGKMDGLEEGRFEEAVTLLLRQFKRRFSRLDDDVELKLRALPLSKIEDLGEAFVDFKEADDLTRWLNEHSENGGDQSATTLQTG